MYKRPKNVLSKDCYKIYENKICNLKGNMKVTIQTIQTS